MAFANLNEQVAVAPAFRLRANRVTDLEKGFLIDANANFTLYANPGDRIVAPDERTFAEVLEVVSDTKLKLSQDIMTMVGSRYDLLRPAKKPLRPGLGIESLIATLRAESDPSGGPYSIYPVELVRTDGRRAVVIARSDQSGRLTNLLEARRSDGTVYSRIQPLLPTSREWYEVWNYRLTNVNLVVEGMDKTFVSVVAER